ncbi:PKD domain-containing protein [uncultured Kordia sp.]|uniref:PKD domain-containing protein n=1 Tax=uncultured Kordia sp. TaxID=507699 RepID=UPI002605B4EF|nr:PKD domain-containing protein [uncultured Kordia sp.]
MKFLKYKISLLSLVVLSLAMFTSCEDDNESGVTLIGLEAKFITEIDSKTISFINVSSNATSYSWDLGDGTTSSLSNPVNRYSNGTYTVVLTAFNDNGESSTFQETFTIDGCIDETEENTDPANGDLNWNFLSDDTGFDAFGDIGGAIVANPVLDNVNSSCFVQIYDKTIGCQTWSGVGVELATALDFSTITNKTFKMKVLAQTQVTDVTLRLEFMPFPNVNPFQERIATITQVGQWQELSFDFTGVNAGTFKSMIIYFDRNAPCDGDVYYFDDITQE